MYHFTVANTCFTAPLTRRSKTKFATIKRYNLCLQIIQSQTCYPLNNIFNFQCKNHTIKKLGIQRIHVASLKAKCNRHMDREMGDG